MKNKLDFFKNEFPFNFEEKTSGSVSMNQHSKNLPKDKKLLAMGVAVVAFLVVSFSLFNFFSARGNSFTVTSPSTSDVDSATEDSKSSCIYIHVGGAVVNPGMYTLSHGTRVNDAIKAAGGFAQGAAIDSLNLAKQLSDGEQIIVPTVISSQSGVKGADTGLVSSDNSSLVNINTASIKDLTSLPGVGESTAKKIIADRESNGIFKTKEDLKRVSGIGDKKYKKFAELICV